VQAWAETLLKRTAGRFELADDVQCRVRARERRDFLASVLGPGGTGAELGVFKGHLTPVLTEVTRPVRLYAVDPWYLAEPEWTWARGHRSTVLGLAGALRRSRRAIEDGIVEVRVAFDTDFLADLDDAHLDWAYVDTTHQYEHTCAELDLLARKVRPGGIVAGDDWQTDPHHRHHGVKRAVDEFVSAGRAVVVGVDEALHQWAIRLPGL
jgi:hypothetical protein